MKIYFLINSPYPRYAGGIENWLYNVSERLSKEHEIAIIAHESKEYPVLYSDISDNIKIFKFKTFRSFKISNYFVRSYFVLFDFFLGSYLMGKTLKKIIPKDEKCYVIALDSMFCVKAGLIAKQENKKIKLISSVRAPHAEILGNKFKLLYKFLKMFEANMLNKADKIWANGHDTINLLGKKGYCAQLMKNGVDYKYLDKLELNDSDFKELVSDKITVVSVGSLLPIKGIYELINAVSIIYNESRINIQLVFIGKGNKKPFERYAVKKNINQNTHFLGHRNNPISYIKKCTISACLSGGSGMSMAAIESMVAGVPIIAWDSPVYQQFNKNQKTMMLVEKNNINALVYGIYEIINNYKYYLNISSNAKNEAQQYDWEIVCNDILNLLRDD